MAEKSETENSAEKSLLRLADTLRAGLPVSFRDDVVEKLYEDANRIAAVVVEIGEDRGKRSFDQKLDRVLTSPLWGLPIMLILLAAIFWLTIVGSNVPSQMLATMLLRAGDWGWALFNDMGVPWWISGFIWKGVYLSTAWVVAVMLPPMAIFFPLFTILEDLGYLPRVAFNMDWLFHRAGAHGKQALTMAMGFGCNAAGVIAARIIDSPRERLIAVLTNNFVPCNGRFSLLIMLSTIFVARAFPPAMASFAAAGSIIIVVLIGVLFTLAVSFVLAKTVLKGEASAFTLELPPYRRPNLLRTLYTSLIDRTIFVLFRAVFTAAPAGAVIWLLSNIYTNDGTLAHLVATYLNPIGHLIGLDGVIILAYIIAIPANEIVVPTMLMVYMGKDSMSDIVSLDAIRDLLVVQEGWTLKTAVCLMLFSLLHNPCATTILTIWNETKSLRWTSLAVMMPLAIAFIVCFVVANTWVV